MTVRGLAIAASAVALLLSGCVTGQPTDFSEFQTGAPAAPVEPLAAVSSVYVNYDNGRVLMRWSAPDDERYLTGFEILLNGEPRFSIRSPDRRFVDLGPLAPYSEHDVTIIPTSDGGAWGEQLTVQVYVDEGAQYPEPRYAEPSPEPTPSDPGARIVVIPGPADSSPAAGDPVAPLPPGPLDPIPGSTPASEPTATGPYAPPEVVGAAALRCRQLSDTLYLHRFSVDLRGGSNWSTQSQNAPAATHIVDAYTAKSIHTLESVWIAQGMGDDALSEPAEEIAVPPILSACPTPGPEPSLTGSPSPSLNSTASPSP